MRQQLFVLTALAVLFSACEKDNTVTEDSSVESTIMTANAKGQMDMVLKFPGQEKTYSAKFADATLECKFSRDSEGRITRIDEEFVYDLPYLYDYYGYKGEDFTRDSYSLTITYDGSTATLKLDYDDSAYIITLNDDGYAAEMYEEDSPETVYHYTYSDDGYLKKSERYKNGTVSSTRELIWQNGNYYPDDEEVEYSTETNIFGNIVYFLDAASPHQFSTTGLFGKACKNLPVSVVDKEDEMGYGKIGYNLSGTTLSVTFDSAMGTSCDETELNFVKQIPFDCKTVSAIPSGAPSGLKSNPSDYAVELTDSVFVVKQISDGVYADMIKHCFHNVRNGLSSETVTELANWADFLLVRNADGTYSTADSSATYTITAEYDYLDDYYGMTITLVNTADASDKSVIKAGLDYGIIGTGMIAA